MITNKYEMHVFMFGPFLFPNIKK